MQFCSYTCVLLSIIVIPFTGYVLHYNTVYLDVSSITKYVQNVICKIPSSNHVISFCEERKNGLLKDADNNKDPTIPLYSDIETYKMCMLANNDDEHLKSKGLHQHGFNEFVSEKIGVFRSVPDVRNPICKTKMYSNELPTASIVMCFYNEAWSTLLRSIHSIFRQTPSHLLKEIILLDDYSSLGHLKLRLDEYVKTNFTKLKVIHSEKRLGLIRARMAAAKHASGEVLVFLDSHIEAGVDWLVPLLDEIAKNRHTVVVPVVDTIEAETMVYRAADLVRGGFTWSLLHNWEQLPLDIAKKVEEDAEPFISPTMPGGLFAMDRQYFYELGEYDSGMDIWGGENMEISFRIWQCGGKLEIVPCSRVGHVFRMFRPYSSPSGEDTATMNAARVAHVWLDEYKDHFFDFRPEARDKNYGDISKRLALRKRLKCKSFKWFLENIHPEQVVPGEKPKVARAFMRPQLKKKEKIVSRGKIRHVTSGLCGKPENDPPSKGDKLFSTNCDLLDETTGEFIFTEDRQVRLTRSKLCLETSENKREGSSVSLMKCHYSGAAQTWLQMEKNKSSVFFNPASGKCLAFPKAAKKVQLSLDFCSSKKTQGFQAYTAMYSFHSHDEMANQLVFLINHNEMFSEPL